MVFVVVVLLVVLGKTIWLFVHNFLKKLTICSLIVFKVIQKKKGRKKERKY